MLLIGLQRATTSAARHRTLAVGKLVREVYIHASDLGSNLYMHSYDWGRGQPSSSLLRSIDEFKETVSFVNSLPSYPLRG